MFTNCIIFIFRPNRKSNQLAKKHFQRQKGFGWFIETGLLLLAYLRMTKKEARKMKASKKMAKFVFNQIIMEISLRSVQYEYRTKKYIGFKCILLFEYSSLKFLHSFYRLMKMMWKKQILLASTRLKIWPNYVFSTSHLFFTPYDNVLEISLLIHLLVLLSYPSIPWPHWLYTLKKLSRYFFS